MEILETCYENDMRNAYTVLQAPSSLTETTINHCRVIYTNFDICSYRKYKLKTTR